MRVEDSVDMWRSRARSLVASGMTVNAWCEENRVRKSTFHQGLRRFRDEEPEIFGGFEAAHAGDGRRNWYEAVRRAGADAAGPAPEFVEVAVCPAPAPAGAAVAVGLRTMTALVGPGVDEGALRALLRAAASPWTPWRPRRG